MTALEYQVRPSAQVIGRWAITRTRIPSRISTPNAARVGLAPQWPHFMPLTGTWTSRFPRYPEMLHRPG